MSQRSWAVRITRMAYKENPLHPFDPTVDHLLFIDAKSISAEHRRGRISNEVVHNGDRRRCEPCIERSFWALLAFAGRARKNNWTRDEALNYLVEHPAAYDSFAREGTRRRNTSRGVQAKPLDAAKGKIYNDALNDAATRGDLDVPVPTAVKLLGWVIRSVQDESSTVTNGEFTDWDQLEHDLNWEFPTPAWVVFSQITKASEAVPKACRKLDQHVFRHSSRFAGCTMTAADESDRQENWIDNMSAENSVTSSETSGFTRLVERVVLRLETRRSKDLDVARHWAHRIVAETYGSAQPSAQLDQLIDLIVKEAIATANVT